MIVDLASHHLSNSLLGKSRIHIAQKRTLSKNVTFLLTTLSDYKVTASLPYINPRVSFVKESITFDIYAKVRQGSCIKINKQNN